MDRGPDSRRCLDMVLVLAEQHGNVAACMGNHDLAAIGAMGLVPTPAASHWHMRHIADYESWPTFASYGVEMGEVEFDRLADAVRDVKPFYDPNDECYTGGVVPAELEGLRDDVFGRLEALLADLCGRMELRDELRRNRPAAERSLTLSPADPAPLATRPRGEPRRAARPPVRP